MESPKANPASCRARASAWCAALVAAAAAAPAADLPFGWTPAPPAALRTPAPRRLTLVWYDPQRQLPLGFAGAADEVRSIFAELGVGVSWRAGGPGTSYGEAPEIEIAVIALAEDPSPSRRGRSILGLVQREHRPARNVWVFMASIRRAVGLDPGEAAREPSEHFLLARALGRVVAHEVVHAVAPDHPHDQRGLMKHAFSRRTLVGGRVPLGEGCAHAVLAGLAAWREPRPFGPGAGEIAVAGP